jgi:hypothetical protein
MKYALAIAITLATSVSVQAASPEETYLAARDAAIAKLNPPGGQPTLTDATIKQEERAREALGRQMRAVIGPLNVKGYTGEGTYNVGSLFNGDMETGTLDGLLFTRNKDIRLVVTTVSLAERWIKSPDGLAASKGEMPKDLKSALTLDLFYTRSSSFDAAVDNMGELPVTTPAGATFAYAMLSTRRQDIGVTPAKEMLVGVIAPPRVYVVSTPIAPIKMMPACEKLSRDADKKADRMQRGTSDDAEAVRQKGDADMLKCFAERIKTTLAFALLIKQAQTIVDGLVAK